MKISRLDEIVKNNVAYSTQAPSDMQTVFILQDISATLAMIYDHMDGNEEREKEEPTISYMAKVIPFDELPKYDSMFLETHDFPIIYEVRFDMIDKSGTNLEILNGKTVDGKVILNAFGDELIFETKKYNKKWRCWNVEPNEERRKQQKWEK